MGDNGSDLIIKDAAKFTLGGYISSIFAFISGVVVRRVLSPVLMGTYVELLLIFEYSKYNHLGVFNALDRQIPYHRGKKEHEKVDEVKNTGLSFSLFTAVLIASVITLYSCIFKEQLTPHTLLGLKVVAIMVIIQSTNSFYICLARTHHLFGALSKYLIVIALSDVFFKVILGFRFGLMGILWATVMTLFVGIAYLFYKTGFRFDLRKKISGKTLRFLLGIGFPLLLAGFTFLALKSVDRIMIIVLLTKEELGYYSIAVMMHSFIFQLPNLIYVVLFPRFYEAFGRAENDVHRLKGFMEKPTLAFAYLFPIGIGVAAIILPIFVSYLLPKYINGIIPAEILLFGTFFISITSMSGYLMIALKKQHALILVGAISVVISASLNLLLIKVFQMGIMGVALGTAMSYFLYSLIMIMYTLKHYMKGTYHKLKYFMNLYLPIVWVTFIFYTFRPFFSYSFKNIGIDLWRAVMQIILLLVFTCPLIWRVNKKIGLFYKLKQACSGMSNN